MVLVKGLEIGAVDGEVEEEVVALQLVVRVAVVVTILLLKTAVV